MIPMHTSGSVTADCDHKLQPASPKFLTCRPSPKAGVPAFGPDGLERDRRAGCHAAGSPRSPLKPRLKTALADPDLRRGACWNSRRMYPQPDQIGAEPLRRLIASDIERFGPIIQAVGVKLE